MAATNQVWLGSLPHGISEADALEELHAYNVKPFKLLVRHRQPWQDAVLVLCDMMFRVCSLPLRFNFSDSTRYVCTSMSLDFRNTYLCDYRGRQDSFAVAYFASAELAESCLQKTVVWSNRSRATIRPSVSMHTYICCR